jgi:hypothetical protein
VKGNFKSKWAGHKNLSSLHMISFPSCYPRCRPCQLFSRGQCEYGCTYTLLLKISKSLCISLTLICAYFGIKNNHVWHTHKCENVIFNFCEQYTTNHYNVIWTICHFPVDYIQLYFFVKLTQVSISIICTWKKNILFFNLFSNIAFLILKKTGARTRVHPGIFTAC